MNNPLSDDPRYALFPAPVGSAGHRLWSMLHSRLPEVTRRGYVDGFERVNLVEGREWSGARARECAAGLPSRFAGRTIVLLGQPVRAAVGLPRLLLHPVHWRGCWWRQIPHPSGRCRWYNEEKNRALVAQMLMELYQEGQRNAES